MATYDPHKKNGSQTGWNWKESAIQLIWLLIIVNSLISAYLIGVIGMSLIKSDSFACCVFISTFLAFVITVFIQKQFFDWRFNSEFSPEKQDEMKRKLHKYLKDECKLPNQKSE